jgi:hypothetical protein
MSGAMRIEPTCVQKQCQRMSARDEGKVWLWATSTYTLHSGVRTGQDTDLLVPLLFGEPFVGECDERSVEVFEAELIAIEGYDIVWYVVSLWRWR